MTSKSRRTQGRAFAEAGSSIEKPYEPTPQEREAMEAYRARRKARKPSPRLKVTEKSGVCSIAPDHADVGIGGALIMEALGTADPEFYQSFMLQLGGASAVAGRADESKMNFLLSVVKGIEPRDQLEAMLAAQMAAIHMATMTFAQRLAHVETIPQQDSAERAFNKLARTFASQLEALRRYRTGGEQRVTVEHVTVNEGGQAIVGNVSHGARRRAPREDAG